MANPVGSDDDREEWDRLWAATTQRALRPPFRLGVRLDPRFGDLVSATISPAPVELVSPTWWFETSLCPLCGRSTTRSPIGAPRMAAKLNLAFSGGFSCGQCVWAHVACFERCPDTGVRSPIPW